ncbi:MAG TPA: hypothetical protein VL947_12645 [Cytophagales bacterium]|nr:hypothetical protein [Cytophagales bacterium]
MSIVLTWMALCTSCDRERLDTKEFSKELKAKKIRRLTEGQISANALKLGNLLSDTLDVLFAQHHCDLHHLPVVQSFEEDFGASVHLYGAQDTATVDTLTKQVLQSTLYGLYHKVAQASEPNVQYLKNEYWLYSRPLKHGQCGLQVPTILCIVISQPEMIKKLN